MLTLTLDVPLTLILTYDTIDSVRTAVLSRICPSTFTLVILTSFGYLTSTRSLIHASPAQLMKDAGYATHAIGKVLKVRVRVKVRAKVWS